MSDKKDKASKSVVAAARRAAQRLGERLLGGGSGGGLDRGKAARDLAIAQALESANPEKRKLKKGGKIGNKKKGGAPHNRLY